MESFDNNKFKKEMGLTDRKLQPYDYERYRKVNPNLKEEVYKQLRINGSEWKILCGLKVSTHWGSEILDEVWHLKNNEGYKETDFYKFRFKPENYLKLKTW